MSTYRIPPTETYRLTVGSEGSACALCGQRTELATILGVSETYGDKPDGYAHDLTICTSCLALAIEAVSGFRMTRVLRQMYKARDDARNIRLVDPA